MSKVHNLPCAPLHYQGSVKGHPLYDCHCGNVIKSIDYHELIIKLRTQQNEGIKQDNTLTYTDWISLLVGQANEAALRSFHLHFQYALANFSKEQQKRDDIYAQRRS